MKTIRTLQLLLVILLLLCIVAPVEAGKDRDDEEDSEEDSEEDESSEEVDSGEEPEAVVADSAEATATIAGLDPSFVETACAKAANGEVFKQGRAFNVQYYYELVTVNKDTVVRATEVIDEAVKKYMQQEFVLRNCPSNRRLLQGLDESVQPQQRYHHRRLLETVVGVGLGSPDELLDNNCQGSKPSGFEEICYRVLASSMLFVNENADVDDETLLAITLATLNRGFKQFKLGEGDLKSLKFMGEGNEYATAANDANGGARGDQVLVQGTADDNNDGGDGLSAVAVVFLSLFLLLVVVGGMFLVKRRHDINQRVDEIAAKTKGFNEMEDDRTEGPTQDEDVENLGVQIVTTGDTIDSSDNDDTPGNTEMILQDLEGNDSSSSTGKGKRRFSRRSKRSSRGSKSKAESEMSYPDPSPEKPPSHSKDAASWASFGSSRRPSASLASSNHDLELDRSVSEFSFPIDRRPRQKIPNTVQL